MFRVTNSWPHFGHRHSSFLGRSSMDRVWAGTGRVTSRMPVSFGIFGNVALTLTELRQPLRKGWHVLTGDGRADAGRMVSDRKSTRLNSSQANISYAVFC